MATATDNPLHTLTPEQIDAIGKEFDAIHDDVFDSLGARDAAYIRAIIALHRRLALMGRAMLVASRNRPMWLAGTATLSAAKILENMEIGHNVMHGQWDWMNDPVINSTAWDWDTASTKEAWKHSHNYVHHTYTNILGLDRDLGYDIMRIAPEQPWSPVYLLQPLYNLLLMAFFEWGVALHDLDYAEIRSGQKSKRQLNRELKGMAAKARAQIVKDYVAFPLLSAAIATGVTLGVDAAAERRRRRRGGPFGRLRRRPRGDDAAALARQTFKATLAADFWANIVRNVWAHAIIFCGHFPDQTYTFTQAETAEESRGARYVRQLLGSANIEGGPMFHLASGNLSYQVEHHLYPDMPSTRYGEIAPKVRDICERYGLPYNTGPFLRQWGMVQRTILRLAFPGGRRRPKPGPYHARDSDGAAPRSAAEPVGTGSVSD